MSISSIYGSYASTSSIWNFDSLSAEKNSSEEKQSATTNKTSGTDSTEKNPYAGLNTTLDVLSSALSGIMDDLNLGKNDKISFKTLSEYNQKLQDSLTEQVKEDLRELGLDEDTKFSITINANGSGFSVNCNDPDAKAVIETYLNDNPDVVSSFEKIQSLNKLEESRKKQGLDVDAIRNRLQIESMTAWFSATDSVASFYSGGAAYYSGINLIA